MANSLLGLTFVSPILAIGSNPSTTNPASNVLVPSKWARTFRTTVATGTQTIDLDLGTTTALSAIFLNHLNFSTVQFSGSATQGAGTNLYVTAQSTYPDVRVANRRKAIYLAAGAPAGAEGGGLGAWNVPFNHRWLRISMSNAFAGATYFELGAVVLVPTMVTMLNNWKAPYAWTPVEPFTELPYPDNGGVEVNVTGRTRWTANVEVFAQSAAAKDQLHVLTNLGIGAPWLMYENRGDIAAAYLVKRRAAVTFSESFRFADVGPFVIEECT